MVFGGVKRATYEATNATGRSRRAHNLGSFSGPECHARGPLGSAKPRGVGKLHAHIRLLERPCCQAVSGFHRPEPDRLIRTTTDEGLSIRREMDCAYAAAMIVAHVIEMMKTAGKIDGPAVDCTSATAAH